MTPPPWAWGLARESAGAQTSSPQLCPGEESGGEVAGLSALARWGLFMRTGPVKRCFPSLDRGLRCAAPGPGAPENNWIQGGSHWASIIQSKGRLPRGFSGAVESSLFLFIYFLKYLFICYARS